MTSERSRSARALLVAASLAALVGCTDQQLEAEAPHEATLNTVAALDGDATWPEFPTLPRYHHAGVELGGGRALVCGGMDSTETYPPNCELLQVEGSTLTSTVFHLPGIPTPDARNNSTLTLLPTGGVLVAGGRPGGSKLDLATAVASRPIADWLQTGDNPSANWLSSETMTVAREQHTAALLGTSVVVFGGYNNTLDGVLMPPPTRPIEVRTDAGTGGSSWSQFGTSETRFGHSATLLKPVGSIARVLVFGGFDSARNEYLRSGFIFSLEGGVETIPDLPGPPRMAHSATLLDDGSVLVVGGQGPDAAGAVALDDAWRYDPATGTGAWRRAGAAGGTAPQPRRHHSAVRLGNYVVVAGGSGPGGPTQTDGKALTSIQSYDSKSDTWSDLRSLSQARAYLQVLKLTDTQIVASGGSTDLTHFPQTSELITLSPLGQPSTDATSCVSGHQADGVCCESDCSGPCEACNAQGLCQPLSGIPHSGHRMCDGNLLCAAGTCPAQCDSTHACAAGFFCAAGTCSLPLNKPLGASCDANDECAKGAPCVDGVCCESECSGPCEACNSKGACRALEKGALPPACAVADGDPLCAARCDGVTRDRCVFPGSESICKAASCVEDRALSASACNGQGICGAVTTDECEPYACDANAECKRTCQRSADCAGGYYCHPLDHHCVAAVHFPASELPACAMGRGRVNQRGVAIAAAACLLFSVCRRRFRPNRQRPRNGSI